MEAKSLKESVLKRPFDIFLSLVGLILSLPIFGIIAAAIKIEDGGPVFFVQERVGKGGRRFRMIKFRTMKHQERHRIVDLENDSRVTKVGRILRATAMDELPQLINILKGDMSFVGPKPLPFEVEDAERERFRTIEEVPGYSLRSQVRPGLTGIAQVFAPKDISRRNKFRYDNIYIRNMSFLLDLKLILLSFWVTLRAKWESRERKI